jgi:hypothetical protein
MSASISIAKFSATQQSKAPLFRTSSACGNGACVAVASLDDGTVLVKDTKNDAHPVLNFTRDEWTAFVTGVKQGEFDR